MIKVKSNITIPEIDFLYNQLHSENGNQEVDLLLPRELNKREFGVVFSFIQFIGSWVRNSDSGKLILPVDTEEQALDYLKNEFAYPCIVLSWEKRIENLNGVNLRSILKIPSQEYFRQMDFFENREKDSIPIFCFDHDLSKRGKSRVFYDANNKLMSEANMDFTLHPAFEKLSNHFNRRVFKDAVKNELSSFYGIIHELFSNTNEHAKTNELGFNLYPNIRALYIKFHNTTLEKYLEVYKNFPGLKAFFSSDFKVNSQNQLYLIEISVVDSGPGLVKRYSNQSELPLSINEEIRIIKDCLYIHNTSSTSLNKVNKGFGLDRILKILDGKGFVRIKTGRADVFRDMRNINYKAHSKSSEIELYDWQTNSSSEFKSNCPVEGTLISILYPLDYTEYE